MKAAAGKVGSERSCVVTRAVKAPDDLIRFVAGPDGVLVPDLRRKLPGRGVWASLSRKTVAEAIRRNAFERSLKTKVAVPPDLPEMIDALMLRDAQQALAMANKAGLVTAGFAKVEAQIATGAVAALLHASDASQDGAAKLDGKLRARAHMEALAEAPDALDEAASPTSARAVPQAKIVTDLTIDELSLALGRENVVHAAVIHGGAARYFLTEIQRLKRYRSRHPEPQAGRPAKSSTEQV